MTFFLFPVNNPESAIRFPQSMELFWLGNKAMREGGCLCAAEVHICTVGCFWGAGAHPEGDMSKVNGTVFDSEMA